MANLLSIPENVIIQHLFPCLDHNDLLRLRRVSKQTKALADAYLWTPRPGHQGTWELKIDSSKDQTLEAFLGMDVPPPSRLHIANRAEKGPSEPRSFFEDEHFEEFMRRYSKYVTSLRLDKLFFPFTSYKELGFYESLVNLKKLRCEEMVTVGGAAQFEEKTKRAEGSFLIRPNWSRKLKIFKLVRADCMDSMWNFINGVSNNLDELLHTFQQMSGDFFALTNLAPVRELIERRAGMRSQSKLVYDWRQLFQSEPLELLQTYASCRDNGVMIKNLRACLLDCLLCDDNGQIDRDDDRIVQNSFLGAWIMNSRVIHQRNLFVGNVIHSFADRLNDNVFLMELPALEYILICRADHHLFHIYPPPRNGYPQWPNLRKMYVRLDTCDESVVRFLLVDIKRPKLEELTLTRNGRRNEAWCILSRPRNLGVSCGNLKKLTISSCTGNNDFFLGLWKWLPLLEHVSLWNCMRLTDKGFIGTDEKRPTFLKLKKLKHLTLAIMPKITDASFRNVFRRLKLTSFKMSSHEVTERITLAGIKELLTGPFARTIEKLDLDELKLENVSKEQLKEVVLCFRSSRMF